MIETLILYLQAMKKKEEVGLIANGKEKDKVSYSTPPESTVDQNHGEQTGLKQS